MPAVRAILLLAIASASLPAQTARPASASVQVSVVRTKESTPKRTILMVRVEGKGMVLGAYEGRLRFDPAAFTVDSAVAGTDGSRFVNAGDAAKGVVRFAGFTPTGFKNTDAIRIVGHGGAAVDGAKLTATIEVAGDLDGKPVAKANFMNATKVTPEK